MFAVCAMSSSDRTADLCWLSGDRKETSASGLSKRGGGESAFLGALQSPAASWTVCPCCGDREERTEQSRGECVKRS